MHGVQSARSPRGRRASYKAVNLQLFLERERARWEPEGAQREAKRSGWCREGRRTRGEGAQGGEGKGKTCAQRGKTRAHGHKWAARAMARRGRRAWGCHARPTRYSKMTKQGAGAGEHGGARTGAHARARAGVTRGGGEGMGGARRRQHAQRGSGGGGGVAWGPVAWMLSLSLVCVALLRISAGTPAAVEPPSS